MTYTTQLAIEEASINVLAYCKLVNVWCYLLSQGDFEAMDFILAHRKCLLSFVSTEVIDAAADDAMLRYCGHNAYTVK
jgi:hypothetical protein